MCLVNVFLLVSCKLTQANSHPQSGWSFQSLERVSTSTNQVVQLCKSHSVGIYSPHEANVS